MQINFKTLLLAMSTDEISFTIILFFRLNVFMGFECGRSSKFFIFRGVITAFRDENGIESICNVNGDVAGAQT